MFSRSSQSKVEHLLVTNMVWSVQILVAIFAGIQFLGCHCVDMLLPQLEEKRNGSGQLAKNSDGADLTQLTLTPVPSQDPIQDEAATLTSKQVVKRGDFMHIDTTSNVLVDQSCSLGPRQAISPAPRTRLAPLVTKQETELERSERINRGFQRAIQFVNILGQVDSYLSGRARAAVHALSRVYDDIDSRSYRCPNMSDYSLGDIQLDIVPQYDVRMVILAVIASMLPVAPSYPNTPPSDITESEDIWQQLTEREREKIKLFSIRPAVPSAMIGCIESLMCNQNT
ncbi:unnamed protein product [Timema podura]|uniref:Uncharacterized protein n=1 Tax=Timema podura TaxID=61482 RepID=A0ABN7NUH6_TIMPD|nr:unnamed protein product [Timema podura]